MRLTFHVDRFLHDIVRAAAHFVKNRADVLAEDAEKRKLDTAEQREKHYQGRIAARRIFSEKIFADSVERVEKSERRETQSDDSGGTKR